MLTKADTLNRRSYDRFELNNTCLLTLPDKSETRCLLTDISSHGAGIFARQALKPDASLRITFESPVFFDAPISRRAKVSWCAQVSANNWECGLDFGLLNTLPLLLRSEH